MRPNSRSLRETDISESSPSLRGLLSPTENIFVMILSSNLNSGKCIYLCSKIPQETQITEPHDLNLFFLSRESTVYSRFVSVICQLNHIHLYIYLRNVSEMGSK